MFHIQALVPAFFSSLFRIASYGFLRIIPSRYLAYTILSTFPAWLLAAWLTPLPVKEAVPADDKAARTYKAYTGSDDSLLNLLLSLPTSSKKIRYASNGINLLLLAMFAEYIITPFVDTASDVVFTRIGAVEPDSVKVVARIPPEYVSEDVHVIWRESTSVSDKEIAWKHGPALAPRESHDWVDVVTIKGLWPNTYYEYSLAVANGSVLDYPESPIPFHTFPDPRLPGNKFSFLVASCNTPNFPYLPFQSQRIKGYDLMSSVMFPEDTFVVPSEDSEEDSVSVKPKSNVPEFLLFLGDFIYADVPFRSGPTAEDYRRLYRRNYQSSSFRKIYERLPMFHSYDDHEVGFIDDFAGDGDDLKEPFLNASDAFKIYIADSNYNAVNEGTYYYDFRYGDSAFFVMDTRRYRTSSTEDMSARVMLGDAQLASFYDWITRVNETAVFKFVVSSVPFTTLWSANAPIDAWAGFPTERQTILDALHSVPNVVILSGDRHEFAAIEYNHETLNTFTEYSTSPLSMFDIPFVRTLSMQGNEFVKRVKKVLVDNEDGPQFITVDEEIPAERVLKYVPLGNHKWSTIEVDTKNSQHPTLTLKLSVNGQSVYTHTIAGKPVKLSSSTAIGVFVQSGIKEMFDRIGIHPSKWF